MAIQSNFPSIKPSLNLDFANTKKLDPRITFARASTGTYYDGKTVAKSEENLLFASQEFESAYWGLLRSTITANATTAPNGSSTADSLIQTTGQTVSGAVSQNLIYSTGTYTFSVFIKPNGKNFCRLAIVDAGTVFRECFFNISTGTVGTSNNGGVGSITIEQNGYYRCSVTYTFTGSGTGSVRIFMADADNSSTVVDSGGVYLWGAQIEQRSTVTAYTPTTTQTITNYVPVLLAATDNVARFDHNPTTSESLGLLIEEQRTNLVTYSEDLSNAVWGKSNASIASNTIVAPDGTQTADAFIENTTATQFHFMNYPVTKAASTITYTFSTYVKDKGRIIGFSFTNGSNGAASNFNPSTGVMAGFGAFGTGFTAISATAAAVGNGWYRLSFVFTVDAAILSFNAQYSTITTGTTNVYTGDGYSGFYNWGAQLETGLFATSYIPTVASQVTRSADLASMTGANFSSWYRQDEGSFVTEVIANNAATAGAQIRRFLEIKNDTSSEIIRFGRGSSNFAIRFGFVSGGVSQTALPSSATAFGTITSNNPDIFAVGYSATIPSLVLDGTKSTDITSGFVGLPTGMTQMNIGSAGAVTLTEILNGTIKRIAFYPKRLTNDQLQALTS